MLFKKKCNDIWEHVCLLRDSMSLIFLHILWAKVLPSVLTGFQGLFIVTSLERYTQCPPYNQRLNILLPCITVFPCRAKDRHLTSLSSKRFKFPQLRVALLQCNPLHIQLFVWPSCLASKVLGEWNRSWHKYTDAWAIKPMPLTQKSLVLCLHPWNRGRQAC